jgi:60 kDa SS-A/Ro ribonucleoprotein
MLKDNLGLQLIKYQNRNGWSHRDVLRLSHPKPLILPDGTSAENELYRFAVGKATQESIAQSPVYSTIKQFGPIVGTYKATKAESAADVVKAIRDYQLPRECIPTQHLNNALVWDALLEKMPVTAMLRNLGKMGAVSLLVNKSEAMKKVISVINKIGTEIKIVHPIQVLQALKVYGQGCGELGDNTWKPVPEVVAALDTAFYASFKNVKPTGKRVNLALDVSGSMATAHIAGLSNISAREASMAMAMVNYRVEENCYVNAFYTAIASKTFNAFASREVSMSPIEIGEADTITTMCGKISNLNFTATDCAAPMITALKNKQLFDAFVIYTDNETWSGKVHPFEALKQYRKATGIPAKLIVVGMTATKFTIADPSDSGMLDVVGFSSDAPAVISEFISS